QVTASGGYLVRIVRNRILLHLLFWTISYYILLNIFSGSGSGFLPIDYLYAAIFTGTLIIPVYLNLLFLIPRYLHARNYPVYILWVVLVLLAGTLFNHYLFASLIDYVLPGYYFISYYSFLDLLKFFFLFLLLTSLLKLAKEWIRLNKDREQLILLEKEKLKAELQALINQVNPHFLFNSLTVLYSLALRKSGETPEAIIRLSEILRYVIYKSDSDYVPIGLEAKIIEDYIHLQRYRVGPQVVIDFTKEIQHDSLIAPVLLLQLLENSFKHGIKGDGDPAFIHMNLQADSTHIYFLIENGKGAKPEAGQSSGIGLKNIRERLRLTYQDRGSLNVTETHHSFSVELVIYLEK
ncbi:MAG TPA: histidine kinase, partial [Anseongella sp.]|nr:histidine kinase [Anseongella sp.]